MEKNVYSQTLHLNNAIEISLGGVWLTLFSFWIPEESGMNSQDFFFLQNIL